MFRSLRFRMAASHAAVLTIILVALGGGGQWLLARNLDRGATSEISTAAREQATRILEQHEVTPPPDSDVPSRAALKVAVFAPNGQIVGEPAEIPSWLHPYAGQTTDLGVSGEEVRVVTLRVSTGGQLVASVVAGRSLISEDRLLHRVRLLLLFGGGVAVIASLAAGWWLAGRAVLPVQLAYEAQAGFAADASHELRTPLTFIRSGVEVLAERDPELGEEVLSEIDYLTGLTQRLLLLARAQRGTMTLDRGPIEVGEICRSAARRSEKASGNRLRLEGGEAPAVGDRFATEAALDAVLENVGVHGGGEATIRWDRDADGVLVSVQDHGAGLPVEMRERVFDRFTRADPSRTRDTGGAGLGLALSRALVQAQGGTMWLEETIGGGLTAKISLPASFPVQRL